MIALPSSTVVNRTLPKEVFYKRLNLSGDIKEHFISDIKRITLTNSLTAETLHLEEDDEISEILVLAIDLKKQDFDYRIAENVARQNKHKLVFLLRFEDNGQLAVYFNKLYKTQWMQLDSLTLDAKGLKLSEVWIGFVEQIAITINVGSKDSITDISERLKKQETILKLQKEIKKLEKLSWVEKQPKRKFELYNQVLELKKELEGL